MAILQLGDGDGVFTINGGTFPKGEFYIDKSGPRLSVIATDNMWLRVTGRYNEWIGAEGETFANVDEAGDYIDGLIVRSDGGGSIPDNSITEEKLSEEVVNKLNSTVDISSKLSKIIEFGDDISGNITLSNSDNSKLREVTALSTITIPNGLDVGWNIQLTNISEDDTTIVASGTLRNGAANKLKPGEGCVIYHKGGNIIQAIGLET